MIDVPLFGLNTVTLITVICVTLIPVSFLALHLVAAHGWDTPDAALLHLAGYMTSCMGAATLALAGAPGGVCWLAAAAGYAAWMSVGFGLWVVRQPRGAR